MQETASPRASSTYVSIQYLRAIAALGVVIVHASPIGQTILIGNAGVDIFFVISGFLMWTITDIRPQSPFNFILHRLVRIAPLYWFVTSLLLVGALVMPSAFPNLKFDLSYALGSYLFVPMRPPGSSETDPIWPVLVQGWTLNYEVLFYALFALCLPLRPRERLLALGVGLIGAVINGLSYAGSNPILMSWSDPLMLEFFAGVLIAIAVRHGVGVSRATGWLLVSASLVLLVGFELSDIATARVIVWGLPAALLVWGAVVLERTGPVIDWGWLRLIGDSSYSLYLTHGLALSVLGKLMHRSWLFFCVGIVASVIAGLVFYYLAERPLTKLAQRLVTRKRGGDRVGAGAITPQAGAPQP
jgi:exopolysaccharide production protein ExoZ